MPLFVPEEPIKVGTINVKLAFLDYVTMFAYLNVELSSSACIYYRYIQQSNGTKICR